MKIFTFCREVSIDITLCVNYTSFLYCEAILWGTISLIHSTTSIFHKWKNISLKVSDRMVQRPDFPGWWVDRGHRVHNF